MWAVKIYALVWILSLVIATGVYAGEFFNEMMLMILGFYFSTLLIIGFVAVLPIWLKEHFAPKY